VRIDRYEVQEELAREGSSVIYRAQDPNLQREVSIRLLESAHDQLDMGRFRSGAQALARLRHEGIVGVHSMGVHRGFPYLVMDHVKGRSLYQRVRRQGPLEPRDAAEVVCAVAQALDYAHSKGILHRDVCPENVILTPGGQALISDFSLSRDLEDESSGLTRSDTWRGSTGYLAPEQVEGRRDLVGPPTDVYGLGATLYFALTGQAPFSKDMPGDRRPRLALPSSLVSSVGSALDQLCATCLANDPEQRYPTLEPMIEDLQRYLQGRGLSRRSRRSWSRALPTAGSTVPLLGVLGVVFVGAGIGFASAVIMQRGGGASEAAATAKPVSSAEPVEVAVTPQATPTSPPPQDLAERRAQAEALCVEGARLSEEDDYARALEILERALELDPEHAQAHAERAYVHMAEQRWEEALEDAQWALRRDPRNVKALEARVMTLVNIGRFAEAIVDSERWGVLDPESVEPFALRGAILTQTGRFEEARASLDEAIRRQPDQARHYVNRAMCKLQGGDARAALSDFDQAAELFKEPRYQPFTNRGMCYLRLKEYEAATADFRRGCEIEPEEANNWNALGVGYLELDDARGALDAWTQAVKIDPRFSDAFLNRARLYADLGRWAEASADLRRAQEVAPREDQELIRRLMRSLKERAGGRR
jgi:serine/threonine protein kinase